MLSSPAALPFALALVLLTGCSGAQEPDGGAAVPQQQAPVFGEEERNAARALSIGSRGAAPQAISPYEQAMACSNAIGTLVDRLRQSRGLSGEQLAIVEQAKAMYDQRIRLLASQGAARARESGGDPEQSAEEGEGAAGALEALGCIQRLAQAD